MLQRIPLLCSGGFSAWGQCSTAALRSWEVGGCEGKVFDPQPRHIFVMEYSWRLGSGIALGVTGLIYSSGELHVPYGVQIPQFALSRRYQSLWIKVLETERCGNTECFIEVEFLVLSDWSDVTARKVPYRVTEGLKFENCRLLGKMVIKVMRKSWFFIRLVWTVWFSEHTWHGGADSEVPAHPAVGVRAGELWGPLHCEW